MSLDQIREALRNPLLSSLESWQMELMEDSIRLADITENTDLQDFTAIVFPASKAYEGFLKSFLLQLELISFETYQSRKLRIGRVLNPDVSFSQKDEIWLYDDVSHYCGEELARKLWQTWLDCRNRLFHYFPKNPVVLSHSKACSSVVVIIETMVAAQQCQITTNPQGSHNHANRVL